MIETLNYKEVPFHFVHCFLADCPKASSPLHQRAIKKVFLKYGIEADPVFDRYEPVYQW